MIYLLGAFFTGVGITLAFVVFARDRQDGYILQHEQDIAVEESGSHNGGGKTKAFYFFREANGLQLVFRKRILYPGSSIGYHLQKEDEIYYILGGHGEMSMNGKSFPVRAGDAILTRPGSSHGLKPLDKDSLTVLINYGIHP